MCNAPGENHGAPTEILGAHAVSGFSEAKLRRRFLAERRPAPR
jgi:hypothetical protein